MSIQCVLLYSSSALFLLTPSLIIISYILQSIWCWVDDGEELDGNFVVNFILIDIFRLEKGSFSKWYDKEGNYKYADFAIFKLVFLLALIPTIIYLSIKFYSISLFILTCIAIVHIARFVRRLGKKFNLHCNDNKLHK